MMSALVVSPVFSVVAGAVAVSVVVSRGAAAVSCDASVVVLSVLTVAVLSLSAGAVVRAPASAAGASVLSRLLGCSAAAGRSARPVSRVSTLARVSLARSFADSRASASSIMVAKVEASAGRDGAGRCVGKSLPRANSLKDTLITILRTHV